MKDEWWLEEEKEKRAQESKPSRGGPKKRENLSGSWSDHNGYF